jgi:hypothetical protein
MQLVLAISLQREYEQPGVVLRIKASVHKLNSPRLLGLPSIPSRL